MRLWTVAQGVAWRTLKLVYTNPSILIPSLIFPLFFFIAFAGGLSQVANVPGFDYEPGYTAFQFCFVLIQSAAFGGVFTGFGIGIAIAVVALALAAGALKGRLERT